MVNPLLAVFESLRIAAVNRTTAPPSPEEKEVDSAIDKAWDDACLARSIEDRRIARVILRSIDRIMKVESQDETEHVAQFTESAIEARVIALAFYWGNDLEDVAFATLGLKRPDFAEAENWQERSRLQAQWWQDVVVPEMNKDD